MSAMPRRRPSSAPQRSVAMCQYPKWRPHSITSSAVPSSAGGISRPNVLAVLRLMTNSYLVGACTGSSRGFAPLRMRSTYVAARLNKSIVFGRRRQRHRSKWSSGMHGSPEGDDATRANRSSRDDLSQTWMRLQSNRRSAPPRMYRARASTRQRRVGRSRSAPPGVIERRLELQRIGRSRRQWWDRE